MMNQLTTTQQELSVPRNKFQHILQNQPVYLDDFNEVYHEVKTQIVKSFHHLEWTLPSRNDLHLLVNEVAASIRVNHRQLRKAEISLCFAKGIRGEYGEFYGLSLVSCDNFFSKYLTSGYRRGLAQSLAAFQLPPVSRELSRKKKIDLSNKAFEIYQIKGFYDDQDNAVYDFLDQELIIPFTPEEKLAILEEARKKIDLEIKKDSLRKRKECFNKQARTMVKGEHLDIPESKRIALHKYFRLLQLKGGMIPFLQHHN